MQKLVFLITIHLIFDIEYYYRLTQNDKLLVRAAWRYFEHRGHEDLIQINRLQEKKGTQTAARIRKASMPPAYLQHTSSIPPACLQRPDLLVEQASM